MTAAPVHTTKTETLTCDRVGPVLTVTLSRPEKHNALSRAAIADLRQVFTDAAGDDGISVAVLRGAGEKSFAAGGDLKDLEAIRTRDQAADMSSTTRTAFDAIRAFPVPVVAALNGNAVGGGAELACACDLRVAASHAQIGFVQGRLGITTAWGGGIDLCGIVGAQKALWLTLSAQVLTAVEARDIGLMDDIAAEGETLDAVIDRITGPLLKQPRNVLYSVKTLNRAVRTTQARGDLEALETGLFADAWVSDAHWDALDAFKSRRRTA